MIPPDLKRPIRPGDLVRIGGKFLWVAEINDTEASLCFPDGIAYWWKVSLDTLELVENPRAARLSRE